MAIGDTTAKQRYVDYIKANCATLPPTIVLDAIDGLFPEPLTVRDLLDILERIDVTDADGSLSFEWQAPGWIDRIITVPCPRPVGRF